VQGRCYVAGSNFQPIFDAKRGGKKAMWSYGVMLKEAENLCGWSGGLEKEDARKCREQKQIKRKDHVLFLLSRNFAPFSLVSFSDKESRASGVKRRPLGARKRQGRLDGEAPGPPVSGCVVQSVRHRLFLSLSNLDFIFIRARCDRLASLSSNVFFPSRRPRASHQPRPSFTSCGSSGLNRFWI
jgi:hypothetical protein